EAALGGDCADGRGAAWSEQSDDHRHGGAGAGSAFTAESASIRSVSAAEADEQEDPCRDDERHDEREPAGDADREPAEPHEEEEDDRPGEGVDSLVDARRAEGHRGRSYLRRRTKNSPSRWRFRPLDPLTVRFRVEPAS